MKILSLTLCEWWDARSHDDGAKIDGPSWEKCVEFTDASRFPNKTDTGECNNVAADYSTALAYMGMYYKDSDMINEALFVAAAVARTSSAEGAPFDAFP